MYRIADLIGQKRPYYHTQDLALIWRISNRNTLYTTITRLIKRGVLIPIHKGFYMTVPIEKIDPVELGIAYLHAFAYLSTESVLSVAGVINQNPEAITLVSSTSRNFKLGNKVYKVRKLKDRYLFNDAGQSQQGNYLIASPERAVADLLYFNSKYYLDNKSLVDFNIVRKIQKEVYRL